MSTQIEVIVDASDIEGGLELLEARLNTLHIPLADVALLWSDNIASNFARTPWPPLKESTYRLKAALGYPADDLVRTGLLRDVTTGGAWEITGGVGEATAMLRPPGHGAFHITGFRHRGGSFVPARDWSMLEQSTIDKMVEVFADYLTSDW